jgi:hypothetical protein
MFSRTRKRGVVPALEALEDRTVPALLGNTLFPADNPWNQQITNAPVAANSQAILNNIINNYGDGRLHPDFGQDSRNSGPLYGIPYNVVHGNSVAKVHVVLGAYAGESDAQDAPIPAGAVIEGDTQNGPTVGLANRGDSHLLVYDEDNNVAYEFYQASRPSENGDGKWHAQQETVWDMTKDSFRTLGYTSADAAGLSLLVGLVRPDEGLPVSQGGQGVIKHAIRFTLQNSIILDQFLYPASHVANSGTNAAVQPPMGARFRLKASVDISGLNPQAKVIAQAMKDYGMIVADNGSNFFFSGASYSVDSSNGFALTWDDNDIQDTVHGLKSLHYSDFEVVDLTPVVTGLSVANGPAGTRVTVLGQNFSGAAGHLQVFFGNTPATNVVVLDDGHVQATAPAGSGTVDVRVQSGVADPNDPSNVNSPLFGYGTSAASGRDLFTYGTATTPPPAVFTVTPDGALWGQNFTGAGWASLSPAGTILADSPSTDAAGKPEVFALAGDHSLWVRTAGAWTMLSPAATIAAQSAAPGDVVFVVAGDNSLWTHTSAGWALLSPAGTILECAAGVDPSGRAEVFALAGDASLWRHTTAGWAELSPAGTISSISVSGDAVFVVAANATLWEHTAAGWAGLPASGPGMAASLSAGADAAGSPLLFVLASDSSLWRYGAAQGWALLSPAGTIQAVLDSQGQDVFVTAGDGNLWEYDGAGWTKLLLG